MGRVMQIAAFSLTEATYAVGGDIGYQVQEAARSARFRVRAKQENVSGVLLPAYESYHTEGNDDFGLTGLGKGGQQVQKCRDTYARAVEMLVELASLQTAFVILDEVIKVVNRRVNAMLVFLMTRFELVLFRSITPIALENTSSFPARKILSNVKRLPQYRITRLLKPLTYVADINSELDELDREEFYRLKKVSQN